MKRLVIIMIFCGGICYGVKAQSATSSKTTISQSSGHKKQKSSSAASKGLSNRKIYNWRDGQRATPTGHTATSSNGDNFAALGRDSSKGRKGQRQ